MVPRDTLAAFDRHLAKRALRFDGVVIGGAALNLLGIVLRPTKDCDILYPEIPAEIRAAARAFAADLRLAGQSLADDWLNNGPAALAGQLQPGWQRRLQPCFTARALDLRSLGREDLLCTKLFALCDRGLDLADCLALAPTAGELTAILPWLTQQDLNPDWPAHVLATLTDLATRLDHAL
jgi:hypothetical protein